MVSGVGDALVGKSGEVDLDVDEMGVEVVGGEGFWWEEKGFGLLSVL